MGTITERNGRFRAEVRKAQTFSSRELAQQWIDALEQQYELKMADINAADLQKRYRYGKHLGLDLDDYPHYGVYAIGAPVYRAVKIGYGVVKSRLKDLQIGSPAVLRVLSVAPGSKETEAMLHEKFFEYRIRGEWYLWKDEIFAEFERLRDEANDVLGN